MAALPLLQGQRTMALSTLDHIASVHMQLMRTIGTERRLPMEELVARTGLPAYTIKRVIATLRSEMGAEGILRYTKNPRGYYYSERFSPFQLPISAEEHQALCLLREMLNAFRNTPYEPAMRNALQTIQQLMPEQQAMYTADGPIFFCLQQPSYVDDPSISLYFKPLLAAIKEGRQLEIDYYEITKKALTHRKIDPYYLFCGQGNWYLYAYCHQEKRTADFALHRLKGIRELPTRFPPADPMKISQKLRQRFGLIEGPVMDIAIRFVPRRAEWVRERQWHPSQVFEDQKDGSTILRMRVEGLPSVARWVLGFGGDAIPLQPPQLVDEVRQAAQLIERALSLSVTEGQQG